MPIFDALKEIPGYAEAIHQEQVMRDFAFLGLNEQIGPFEVIQLNLERWRLLHLAGNPLLFGETPTPAQLSQFLWVLSPAYGRKGRLARLKHNLKCRYYFRQPQAASMIVGAARKYLSDTFHDLEGKARGNEYVVSYFNDSAYFCALLGTELGYSQRKVMEMPIRQLLQFVRVIRVMKDPNTILGNPSEKLISDWLEIRNAEQRKQRE